MSTIIQDAPAVDLDAPQSVLTADDFLEHGYHYLQGLEDSLKHRRIYLSDRGRQRMHHVCGWMQGIKDAGSIDLANAHANQFAHRLHYLVWERNVEIDIPPRNCFAGGKVVVPANKVVLHDDGCMNSFGFSVYTPHPDQHELYEEFCRLIGIGHDTAGAERELAKYGIVTTVELNAHRWDRNLSEEVRLPCRSMSDMVYYRKSYHGGLIYHRSHSVTSNGSWSTHT